MTRKPILAEYPYRILLIMNITNYLWNWNWILLIFVIIQVVKWSTTNGKDIEQLDLIIYDQILKLYTTT